MEVEILFLQRKDCNVQPDGTGIFNNRKMLIAGTL
jgi:hypothetical protein